MSAAMHMVRMAVIVTRVFLVVIVRHQFGFAWKSFMGYYLRSHERRTSNGLHLGINKSGGTPRLDVERRPQPHAMPGKQRAEGLRRVESALRAQILEPACPDRNMVYFLTQNDLEDGDRKSTRLNSSH